MDSGHTRFLGFSARHRRGTLLGILYLQTGRNLAVPIVAHGIQDSIDLVLIFFGRYATL